MTTTTPTFREVAEKHADALKAAAADIAAALAHDAAAVGPDVTRLHRAVQGIGAAAGILVALQDGAYEPTTYKPSIGVRRDPSTGITTEVR